MKTKISAIAILCCCLLVSVFSCQKETIAPKIADKTPVVSIAETSLNELRKELPDHVTIEPATEVLTDTEIAPLGESDRIPYPYPIDYADCNYTGCFPLVTTYQQMQTIANFSCRPVKRKICCCFKGRYMCFTINVSPTIICPDTPILKPDIEIAEEKVPITFEDN